jgi:hypothetical protein
MGGLQCTELVGRFTMVLIAALAPAAVYVGLMVLEGWGRRNAPGGQCPRAPANDVAASAGFQHPIDRRPADLEGLRYFRGGRAGNAVARRVLPRLWHEPRLSSEGRPPSLASVATLVLGLRCSWCSAPMPRIHGLHALPPAAKAAASNLRPGDWTASALAGTNQNRPPAICGPRNTSHPSYRPIPKNATIPSTLFSG